MCREACRPLASLLLAITYIRIGALRVTETGYIEFLAVGREQFGIAHPDGISGSSRTHLHTHPTCHVLTKIHDITITILLDGHSFHLAHHLHIGRLRAVQATIRKRHPLGSQPFAVIISHRRPCTKLLSCIILFTVVFVVATDRTVAREFPILLIAADHLTSTVIVFDNQVQAHLRIAKLHDFIRFVVLTHGVETSITQHHADGIVCRQHRSDVKRIVEHSAPIVCRCRSHHLIAHLLSVDKQLIKSQSGDVYRSTLDTALSFKLRTEIAGAQATVGHFLVPCKRCIPTYPAARPMRLAQQSHSPGSRFAPFGFTIGRVDFHFPKATLVALQFLAPIRHVKGLVGIHPTGVP